MADPEHLNLASFIKSVHKDLRDRSRSGDPERIWSEHLEDESLLEKYALSMKLLATKYWTNEDNSRINWIYDQIYQYFFQEGYMHERQRDIKFSKRMGVDIAHSFYDVQICNNKIKVLDVGSCYNPFEVFENLDVVAVDIAPSTPSVIKCDFLQVEIGANTHVSEDKQIQTLGRKSFNVVIFCMLLEYLPSTRQRFQCIKKSVELLMEDGLLCIVTPDSSHQAKNMHQIKSWRRGLQRMGMRNVAYHKSKHFHGIVCRKPSQIVHDLTKEESANEDMDNVEEMFFILQDSVKDCEVDLVDHVELDRDSFVTDFQELPDL